MNGNLGKVIGSIALIILAAVLIVWHVSGGKKSAPEMSAEQKSKIAAEDQAALDVLTDAFTAAEKGGWNTTGKYWAPKAFNSKTKKALADALGSNPSVSMLDKVSIGRDGDYPECKSAVITIDKQSYYFRLAPEGKGKTGKYKIAEFGLW